MTISAVIPRGLVPREARARPIILALVHETNQVVAELAARELEVVVAGTCELTVQLHAKLRPDLVVVDPALFDEDDFELCLRLRSAPLGAVPILLLSAPDQLEATGRALEHGATDFVTTPVSATLLAHRIHLLVRSREALVRAEDAMSGAVQAQRLARFVHWRYDPDARTFSWSAGADSVFAGLRGEGLLDDALLRWVHSSDRARVEASLGKADPQHVEYRLLLGEGDARVVRQESSPERDVVTGRVCIVGTVQDMTELREAEGQAERLAYYDDLTNLPNRAHAQRYLKAALATAKVRSQQVAVLSLGLDLFRHVNDTVGHSGGNAVLQEIARRLKSVIADAASGERRPEPMFARLGGDEFVVILRDVRNHDEVATLFRLLAARIVEPYVVEGAQVVVSCSAGIATFPDNGRDVDTLFGHADAALHEAKARGRGGLQLFDLEIQQKLERRLEVERCLRAALASGESLELHYQPQVEVPSGRVAGVEALLRWRSNAGGSFSPAEIVSVAEETGLIQRLGDWVLRTACLQAKEWSERGPRPIRVAVNVSARQFSACDFEEKVAALLAETQLDASLLELEITEGVLMFDTSFTCRVLTQLKLLGVRIALDDFGTGYSSLAYLTRFPIDCLKIDRSFIKELGVADKSEAIVAAIIALARSLSIDVVAEGVETVPQREFLERFGSLEIQGWLFSKALPHDLAKAWIERHERALDEVRASRRVGSSRA